MTADLGIPLQPAGVETMSDAKAVASALFGSGSSSESMLVRMGELVRVDTLRGVPAFAEWWAQTSEVLARCGSIPTNPYGESAISVPRGLSEGLPVGLQIMGPTMVDDRIYRVAVAPESVIPALTLPKL